MSLLTKFLPPVLFSPIKVDRLKTYPPTVAVVYLWQIKGLSPIWPFKRNTLTAVGRTSLRSGKENI
jgi:hypothetical protein